MPLPADFQELSQAVGSDQTSMRQLEIYVTKDPILTAAVLRHASFVFPSSSGGYSLRTALMAMGTRELRSLVSSLVLHQRLAEGQPSHFPSERYSNYSLATAAFARVLFTKRDKVEPIATHWNADDVFSAALLHGLGLPMLARLSEPAYRRTRDWCQMKGHTFYEGFETMFNGSLHELAAQAAEAWSLSPQFSLVIRWVGRPDLAPEQHDVLAIIQYASQLAGRLVGPVEDWKCATPLSPELTARFGLSEADVVDLASALGAYNLKPASPFAA
ncbi:MAG: hypothetical protein HONBIEJF_02657 [Fimbriimonadaceae bacterium]|nr:hypothetical protein [Fimbriimonadaceae bacterium]